MDGCATEKKIFAVEEVTELQGHRVDKSSPWNVTLARMTTDSTMEKTVVQF